MAREYMNILDITPSLHKKWTVLIQVVESGHTQKTKEDKKFRRLLFTDSQGTKVPAVIFSDHLPFFERTFKPYKRYYISNARLLPTNPRFRVGSYEQSWVLSKQTLVEPHLEEVPPQLPCQFDFTPMSQLYKYADAENYQNIRGVVLKCFPTQQVKQGSDSSIKRDVVIVNEEKKLIMLTMWDSFVENEGQILEQMIDKGPMIFAMQVKVTTFNGISLTTRMGSSIIINPPVIEDLQLEKWHTKTKSEVTELLENESYKNVDILLPHPEEKDILPIARAIATMRTGIPTWLKGTLNLPIQDRTFTQTVCANCQKPVVADVNWIITCPVCKRELKVQVISRATVEVKDETGSFSGLMSTPQIDKFIQINPTTLKDVEDSGNDPHTQLAASINSLTIVAFVRSYEAKLQDKHTTRFVIVNAHKSQQECIVQAQSSTPNEVPIVSVPNPTSPKQNHKRKHPNVPSPTRGETSSVGAQQAKKRLK